jgi:proteasome lid subunit RPN8/RPN11
MRVRQAVFDAITAHARGQGPRECCGLLVAHAGVIVEAVPATNVAAEPHRRYELSPVDHLAVIKRCRELTNRGTGTFEVVGVYHSHPRTAPVPSPTDLEQAFEEFLYVIAGPADASAPLDIRGYRLRQGQFEREELIVDEPLPGATPRATAPSASGTRD